MFASKTPRDLFPEPEPTGDYWWDQRYAAAMHSWRDGFTQHNAPNRILTLVRSGGASVSDVLDAFAPGFDQFAYPYSGPEIEHAYRVLSRLAVL